MFFFFFFLRLSVFVKAPHLRQWNCGKWRSYLFWEKTLKAKRSVGRCLAHLRLGLCVKRIFFSFFLKPTSRAPALIQSGYLTHKPLWPLPAPTMNHIYLRLGDRHMRVHTHNYVSQYCCCAHERRIKMPIQHKQPPTHTYSVHTCAHTHEHEHKYTHTHTPPQCSRER